MRPPRGYDHEYPMIILGVVVSEAQAKLQSDINFWFHEDRSKVNLVFTFTVDRKSPRIEIKSGS